MRAHSNTATEAEEIIIIIIKIFLSILEAKFVLCILGQPCLAQLLNLTVKIFSNPLIRLISLTAKEPIKLVWMGYRVNCMLFMHQKIKCNTSIQLTEHDHVLLNQKIYMLSWLS